MLKFNKKKSRSYFVRSILGISSCFTFYLYFSYSVEASGLFPASSYSLPLGKDILLWPKRRACNSVVWKSSNPEIASINSYGIAHSNSLGKTEISVFNPQTNSTSTCEINVIPPEPVKYVYANENSHVSNSSVEIKVLTPKEATAVKIELTKKDYKHEFQIYDKSGFKDWYAWNANISLPDPGNYNIKALSFIDGNWKECKNSYSYFYVDNKNSAASSEERGISQKGINFISKCEGFVPHVYKDVTNVLTIGYGKVIPSYNSFYNNITKDEAVLELVNVLNSSGFISSVNNLLVKNNIQFNQHQFDALVSFTYNVGKNWIYGESNLKKLILHLKNNDCTGHGSVNSKTGLYVRQQPSIKSRKLALLPNKTTVTILSSEKKNGNWYHIKTSSGIIGYCYGEFLNVGQAGKKDLSCIEKEKFIREFLKYHHAQGKCFKGLLARRLKELEIFFDGNYLSHPNYKKYIIPPCIKNKIRV